MKYRVKNRLTIQRNKLALLLAILIFDPVRCTVPQTAALAAQFPPAIVINEGKTAQGFGYLSGGGKGKNAQQVFVWDLGESQKAAPEKTRN